MAARGWWLCWIHPFDFNTLSSPLQGLGNWKTLCFEALQDLIHLMEAKWPIILTIDRGCIISIDIKTSNQTPIDTLLLWTFPNHILTLLYIQKRSTRWKSSEENGSRDEYFQLNKNCQEPKESYGGDYRKERPIPCEDASLQKFNQLKLRCPKWEIIGFW